MTMVVLMCFMFIFCVFYGAGVCFNACGVVCVVVCCFFLRLGV